MAAISVLVAGKTGNPNRGQVRDDVADKLEAVAARIRAGSIVEPSYFSDNHNQGFSIMGFFTVGQNRKQYPVYIMIEDAAKDDDF